MWFKLVCGISCPCMSLLILDHYVPSHCSVDQTVRERNALQSEAKGWNAAVLPLLTSENLLRLSDTIVQITLPQALEC